MAEPRPTRQQILDLMNGFRAACVIGAAAELDVWTVLGEQSLTAAQLAERLGCDLRAAGMLLDAVAALDLLEKRQDAIQRSAGAAWLVGRRRSAERPAHAAARRQPVARLVAIGLDGESGRPRAAAGQHPRRGGRSGQFHRRDARDFGTDGRRPGGAARPARNSAICLDVGGASGTWTLAFLRAVPDGDGHDLRSARRHRAGQAAAGRHGVRSAGDVGGRRFLRGRAARRRRFRLGQRHLPSAFAAAQSRACSPRCTRRLVPGGRIAIRDVVMEPDRIESPRRGAVRHQHAGQHR